MKSWSYSTLLSYEACAYRLKLKEAGVKPPPPPPDSPLVRGVQTHKEIETFFKTDDVMPDCLDSFVDIVTQAASPKVEYKINLDKTWTPCSWNDAWLRLAIDLLFEDEKGFIHIIDWKTGKKEGNEVKHTWQGQLYAAATLALYPDAPGFYSRFMYLDHGTRLEPKVLTKDRLIPIRESWTRRATKMLSDTELRPKPSKSNCRYCDFKEHCGYAVVE